MAASCFHVQLINIKRNNKSDCKMCSGSVVNTVFLGIKGSVVGDSPEALCVSLRKTLYPLFSTGSTQEDREASRQD